MNPRKCTVARVRFGYPREPANVIPLALRVWAMLALLPVAAFGTVEVHRRAAPTAKTTRRSLQAPVAYSAVKLGREGFKDARGRDFLTLRDGRFDQHRE